MVRESSTELISGKKHVMFADEKPGHLLVQTRLFDPCAPIIKRQRKRLACTAFQPTTVTVKPVEGSLPSVKEGLCGAYDLALVSLTPSNDGHGWVGIVCGTTPSNCTSQVTVDYTMEGGLTGGMVEGVPLKDALEVLMGPREAKVDLGGCELHRVTIPRLPGRTEGTLRLTAVQEVVSMERGEGVALRTHTCDMRWWSPAGQFDATMGLC